MRQERVDDNCKLAFQWQKQYSGVQTVQEAKLSLGQPTVLPHSTFGDDVTSSVTWPFDSPYAISYWWSFGTKPLSVTVSEIFTIQRRMSRNGCHDLDMTFKQRSRSFILVPIDFLYTTSYAYRLSIVPFALGRTVYHNTFRTDRQTDDRRTQHCTNRATVSTAG